MTTKPKTRGAASRKSAHSRRISHASTRFPPVIVLIGLMGAGKTTIGRRVAMMLGLPFVDADHEIERAAGATVAEIFSRHGEAAFREGERRVIQRLLDGTPRVIATGGGAYMNPETRQLIRENGHSVWLRCPIPILFRRLEGRSGRPLLANGNLKETLDMLKQTRHPIYAEADTIVDCEEESVKLAAQRVIAALGDQRHEKSVSVTLGHHHYDIHIGEHVLDHAGAILASILPQKRAVIVTDTRVEALYLKRLEAALHETGFETHSEIVPGGEESKSLGHYSTLCERILATGIERRTAIIGLGGGVVGDLSGFVAASLLRGLPFVQIPTTLLSQVDSSVGGKTGLNSAFGKNLIGAFHQPMVVLADTSTLQTLPDRERVAGYAEIVKAGLIGDAALFSWCEANGLALLAGESSVIAEGVQRACAFKARIVQEDERELASENGRALLNLGHSFGHALEAEFNYDGRLLHGEAVSIGLHLAAALSVRMGYCDVDVVRRVDSHLTTHGMPCTLQDLPSRMSAEKLIGHILKDKKIVNRQATLVLLRGIGDAFTTRDVPLEEIMAFLCAEGCSF